MKRDKFSSERVSEKRSSNSKKTWGMKQLYFSSSPVIFLLGSPTGWLTPAYKLHSTAYNHWTERNCTQLNSFTSNTGLSTAYSCHSLSCWNSFTCNLDHVFHCLKRNVSPSGYCSLTLYLIWGWVNHTVHYRCGWIPGGVARADLCCLERTGGIL